MSDRDAGIKMAYDDLFIMGALEVFLVWVQVEDGFSWLLSLFALAVGFFLAARIYHITHKDEVFGVEQD